jgi:putative flippase GtrA
MTADPEKPAKAARHASAGPGSRLSIWITSVGARVITRLLRYMPASVRGRLETEAGNRFLRFAPTAVVALLTSQVTLALLTGFNMSAGRAALIASVAGAFVSYLLSRWAWESKGRPDLLRETVPFWLVSFAVWGFLSLTAHYAGAWAKQEDLHHLMRHLVVNGAYFLANCITFASRFLIFHYVLFGKKRKAAAANGHAVAGDGQEQIQMALAAETGKHREPQS